MGVSRANHTAVLLRSGRVMVAGGYNGVYFNSVEVYDPGTNTWTLMGSSLNTARMSHTATLLKDGRVLISGGFNVSATICPPARSSIRKRAFGVHPAS